MLKTKVIRFETFIYTFCWAGLIRYSDLCFLMEKYKSSPGDVKPSSNIFKNKDWESIALHLLVVFVSVLWLVVDAFWWYFFIEMSEWLITCLWQLSNKFDDNNFSGWIRDNVECHTRYLLSHPFMRDGWVGDS